MIRQQIRLGIQQKRPIRPKIGTIRPQIRLIRPHIRQIRPQISTIRPHITPIKQHIRLIILIRPIQPTVAKANNRYTSKIQQGVQ